MPSSTVVHEDEWKLPEEEPFPAKLNAVNVRTIKYIAKRGPNEGNEESFDKWEWEFEITDGPYAGIKAWGETEDKISTHPDNKVRIWSEILLDKTFEIGEGIDTDLMLGLPCIITVAHEKRPKKGTTDEFHYRCPVNDVYPAGAVPTAGVDPWAETGDPPF